MPMTLKSEVREYIENIPKGTFNFRQYRRREQKPINLVFTTIDYVAQLPYLRAVTGPAAMVIFIPVFLGWLAYQCIKETLEGR